MKIPCRIKRKIPKIISLLEEQCKKDEYLFMSQKSYTKSIGGKFWEMYTIYVGREENEESIRNIAILNIIKRKSDNKILEYRITGSFPEI